MILLLSLALIPILLMMFFVCGAVSFKEKWMIRILLALIACAVPFIFFALMSPTQQFISNVVALNPLVGLMYVALMYSPGLVGFIMAFHTDRWWKSVLWVLFSLVMVYGCIANYSKVDENQVDSSPLALQQQGWGRAQHDLPPNCSNLFQNPWDQMVRA